MAVGMLKAKTDHAAYIGIGIDPSSGRDL
jgi:hypothetical protein